MNFLDEVREKFKNVVLPPAKKGKTPFAAMLARHRTQVGTLSRAPPLDRTLTQTRIQAALVATKGEGTGKAGKAGKAKVKAGKGKGMKGVSRQAGTDVGGELDDEDDEDGDGTAGAGGGPAVGAGPSPLVRKGSVGRSASVRIREVAVKRHYADPSKSPLRGAAGAAGAAGPTGVVGGGAVRASSGSWQGMGSVEERLDRVDRLIWKGVTESMSTRDDDLHRHPAPTVAARFLGTRDEDSDSDHGSDTDADAAAAHADDVAKLVGSLAGRDQGGNKAKPTTGLSTWAHKVRRLAVGRKAVAAVAVAVDKYTPVPSPLQQVAASETSPTRGGRGQAPVRRDAAHLRLLRRRARSLGDLMDVETAAGGRPCADLASATDQAGYGGNGGGGNGGGSGVRSARGRRALFVDLDPGQVDGADSSTATLPLYSTSQMGGTATPTGRVGSFKRAGSAGVGEAYGPQPSRRTVESMLVALPASAVQRRRRRQSYPSVDNVAWKQETIHAAIF